VGSVRSILSFNLIVFSAKPIALMADMRSNAILRPETNSEINNNDNGPSQTKVFTIFIYLIICNRY
jgi:hypothetical protein